MIVTETTAFSEQFDRILQGTTARFPDWLSRLRQEGMLRFNRVGFPGSKWEDWRFTNVSAIAKTSFDLGDCDISLPGVSEVVAQAALDDATCRLVFINGVFAADLSRLTDLPSGLVVGSLAADLEGLQPFAEGRFGRQASVEHSPFTALNTALFRDGAVIRVADGVHVKPTVQMIFVSTSGQGPVCAVPRNLIHLGRDSRLRLVETHVGGSGEVYLANSVTEIQLGEQARLQHHKLQSDSIAAFHIASTFVSQAASSRYHNDYFAFGGVLSRNEVQCYHVGEHVETVLNGLYMISGNQLADCRTRIDHAMPNCTSHEMYKGVLDGHARGVFNGKIHVHPDAQKTDAKQSNQALLLSDDAVIDTKPELEIYADDVRCTHGATVGELDSQALFYLRSRGIPETLARKILIFAFANDVVQGLSVDSLKLHLESVLLADHGLPSV
jgi:Fe-S cluster assembly protein SufD